MPIIRSRTMINAPIEVVFDAARDIDLHAASMTNTQERAVGGVTSGPIGMGETVEWEAVHFWVRQRLSSRITEYDRPNRFADEMVRGAFHAFKHVHEFRRAGVGTLMLDTFTYESPLGPLGKLADRLFLKRYMRKQLRQHNAYLKRAVEAMPITNTTVLPTTNTARIHE